MDLISSFTLLAVKHLDFLPHTISDIGDITCYGFPALSGYLWRNIVGLNISRTVEQCLTLISNCAPGDFGDGDDL